MTHNDDTDLTERQELADLLRNDPVLRIEGEKLTADQKRAAEDIYRADLRQVGDRTAALDALARVERDTKRAAEALTTAAEWKDALDGMDDSMRETLIRKAKALKSYRGGDFLSHLEGLASEHLGDLRAHCAQSMTMAPYTEASSLCAPIGAVRGCVTMIVAPPGAGKSTAARMLAACVAAGLSFGGVDIQRETGRTLYVMGEQHKDALNRDASRMLLGCGVSEIPEGFQFVRVKKKLSEGELKALVMKQAKGCDLVVVDTLRSVCIGDESKSEFGGFIDQLSDAAHELNCAVLVLAHPGKPQGRGKDKRHEPDLRGSSAITGSADFVLWLDAYKDDNGVTEWLLFKPDVVGKASRVFVKGPDGSRLELNPRMAIKPIDGFAPGASEDVKQRARELGLDFAALHFECRELSATELRARISEPGADTTKIDAQRSAVAQLVANRAAEGLATTVKSVADGCTISRELAARVLATLASEGTIDRVKVEAAKTLDRPLTAKGSSGDVFIPGRWSEVVQ